MGKVLITGCSQGFGLNTSIALARNGFEVCATVRKSSDIEKLHEAIKIYHLEKNLKIEYLELMDLLQDTTSIETIIARYGGFDIVIVNAGMLIQGLQEKMTLENIKKEIDIDLTSNLILTREVVKTMKQQGHGKIVFMSSLSGRRGLPYLSIYSAAKYGMEGLAESLYLELAPYHVDVYLVEPGIYPTKLWSHYQPELDEYSRKLDNFSTFTKKSRDEKEVTFQILKICQNKKKRFHTVFGFSGFIQCLCKPFIYTKIGKEVYLKILKRL